MAQIEIEHLTFAYPSVDSSALDDICLEVFESEFIVLCGPTGCGKSTLLRHIKRELRPHGRLSGTVRYDGVSLDDLEAEESIGIGFVQQNPETQIVTDTVWHELAFALENLGLPNATIRQRVAELAGFFGIDGWFRKAVNELSGGQKQMLNLASVMAMQPKVLILDEPTSQLDPIAAREFLEQVRRINLELGVTVILTEHRLEDAFPMADRVVVMGRGTIHMQGSPADVGMRLSAEPGHGMLKGLPTPMRVYQDVLWGETCPLTVREGRLWLRSFAAAHSAPESAAARPTGTLTMTLPPVMEAKELWFRYSREAVDVLRGLSIAVHSGELHCILGGNGSGKTTLLMLLAGLRPPYRGKVLLDGKDMRRISPTLLYRGNVALLPQDPRTLFSHHTVEKELQTVAGSSLRGRAGSKRMDGLIEKLGLEPLLARHPSDLSGGEQQKAALAMMLLLTPRVLLMDEPTKGLDAEAKEALGAILVDVREEGLAVVMVTHDVEFSAGFSDRCSLLFDGIITTENPPGAFFAGNSFYTTAANRMARDVFPWAITGKEVGEACRALLRAANRNSY